MYNIVCLKWGNKFTPDYVNNLYAGVKRNTTLPIKFHCVTENPKGIHPGINIINLPQLSLSSWWYKLWLFSKEFPIKGRIFYLDLDTIITDNIDDILKVDKPFVTLIDVFKILNPNRTDNWGRWGEQVGSGVMSWDGDFSHIWESFIKNPKENIQSLRPHGDQKWIEKTQKDRHYFQNLFPNTIQSVKVGIAPANKLPKGIKIVCYHGSPSIADSIKGPSKGNGRNFPQQTWVTKFWHCNDL